YPYAQLRMAEVPSYWQMGGYATPTAIFFAENRTLLVDQRDPNRPDLVGRRVAHEVAHQWWGCRLIPASVEGAPLLVESLTKYSELMVMEKMHGRRHVRRLLDYEVDQYLTGRARE